MTRFAWFLPLAISFSLGTGHAAANELSGRVLDSTRTVVAGARVTLIERASSRERVEITATDGQFRFDGLPPGTYLLEAELPGFRTEILELVLDDGARRDVDIVLEIGRLSDDIVVTGTAGAVVSTEAAHASAMVDGRALEGRGVPLVADALRGVAGVRVQQLGAPGSFTTVRFRGLRDADTSLLIDGHQIRDAGGFRGDVTSFFQQLTLANVDRIEIVPGARSSLYGSSASAGVINVVPRLGAPRPTLEAQFEAGALGLVRASLQSQGRIGGRLQYGVGAHRVDVNRGLDAHGVFRNTTIGGVAGVDVTRDIRLTGIVHVSDTPRADLNDSPFPIGPPGNELGFERDLGPVAAFVSDLDDPDARRESRLSAGIVSLSHNLRTNWRYSVTYQRTGTSRDFPDGPALNPILASLGVTESPADVSLVNGRHQVVKTKHELILGNRQFVTAGAEYSREARTQQFSSAAIGISTGPTTDRQATTAVFAQHQASLFERAVHVTTSVRGEFFTVENPESVPELRGLDTPDAYTGGVAVAHLVGESGTKLRAHGATGFRAPSLSERFAIFNSSVGPLRIGNPLLRPERILTVDAGVDQRLFTDRVSLSATYFHNRLKEIITSRRRLFQQTNERGGTSHGIEIAVRAMPIEAIELGGGYTHTRSELVPTADLLRSDNAIAPAGVPRPFESTPGHEWYVRAAVDRARWRLHVEYTGTGRYDEVLFSPRSFRPVLFPFDGYQRVDASATYRWLTGRRTAVDVYVRGQNILDARYVEDGFRTPGASFWGGIRYALR